jgi:hypothetical protein
MAAPATRNSASHSLSGEIKAIGYVAAGLILEAWLSACSPTPEPSQAAAPAATLAQVMAATAVPVTLVQVANTFAIAGRATDLQRTDLDRELTGAVVDWTLSVDDISKDGDSYTLTSLPLPVSDPKAMPLLRVLAVLHPQSPKEISVIHALRTDDRIRVRGVVQGIYLRSVLKLDPAYLQLDASSASKRTGH